MTDCDPVEWTVHGTDREERCGIAAAGDEVSESDGGVEGDKCLGAMDVTGQSSK